jgi:site-specific DNA recombinase
MIKNPSRPRIRCAIYTRKSHEEGLDQEFNSLDAQRQASEAYIESQRHEGWQCLATRYDDGGFTGGNMDRPALKALLDDIRGGRIDCVVVYKVDRLSRSLLDFAKLIDVFDEHEVSFVSVTQQFNTTTSMGRLTLNILLSFAQFEREIIGERIRDKKLATARLGKYIGGQPVLGLDIVDKKYAVNRSEATLVRRIFELFLELQSCRKVAEALNAEGLVTKKYRTKTGKESGGVPWKGRSIYDLLRIPVNFRRRNGRQMVLTCGGEERPAKPDRQVNRALVSAVAKAYRWQEQLESGQYASLEALVCRSHPAAHIPVTRNRRGDP